ncbi:hypothetical protein FQA39_LY19333 [Lamprigera yunnana]|nr:hypothetical protein FQA39_LY19333 [Lamprigera yunnana]
MYQMVNSKSGPTQKTGINFVSNGFIFIRNQPLSYLPNNLTIPIWWNRIKPNLTNIVEILAKQALGGQQQHKAGLVVDWAWVLGQYSVAWVGSNNNHKGAMGWRTRCAISLGFGSQQKMVAYRVLLAKLQGAGLGGAASKTLNHAYPLRLNDCVSSFGTFAVVLRLDGNLEAGA